MVIKSARVAAIPVSGNLLEPAFVNDDAQIQELVANQRAGELWDTVLSDVTPSGLQYQLERARIPEYMGAENWARARWILDYVYWDALHLSLPDAGGNSDSPTIQVVMRHDYPLWMPMHRTFYSDDTVTLSATNTLENHYPLYLEDMNW